MPELFYGMEVPDQLRELAERHQTTSPNWWGSFAPWEWTITRSRRLSIN